MQSKAKFSVLVGCFGDFPQYSLRAVRSILEGQSSDTKSSRIFDLHVGANSCGQETLDQLRSLYDQGLIDSLIESNKNINKCPMKRLLIERCETEFGFWFDDDSHVLPGWDLEVMRFLTENPNMDVAGYFYRIQRTRRYKKFLSQRPWYRGEEFWSEETKKSSLFATGGCYLFRVPFVRRHNYPDKGLVKRADDLLLGDLVAQQGGLLVPFTRNLFEKLRISDGARRGSGEQIQQYLGVDPLTGEANAVRDAELNNTTVDPRDKDVIYELEDSEVLVREASRLQSLGQLEDALSVYLQASEMNPAVSEIHYNIAMTYESMGQIERALEYFDKAIHFKKDYAEAYNNKGNIALKLGNIEGAISLFKKAVALDRNLFAPSNNLGHCYLRQNDHVNAIKFFQRAIAIKPDQPEVNFNLSLAYYRTGQISLALLHARLAVYYAPDFAEAHVHLSLMWFKTQNFKEGWKAFEWRKRSLISKNQTSYEVFLPKDIFSEKDLIVVQEGTDYEAMFFLGCLARLTEKNISINFICSKQIAALAKLIPGVQIGGLNQDKKLKATPLFSLPLLMSLESPPSDFLIKSVEVASQARTKPLNFKNDKFNVGLSWRASINTKTLFSSDVALEKFHKLLEINTANIFSLVERLSDDERKYLHIFSHASALDVTYEDLFGLAEYISQLDLVITVDNQVAAVAGLLGKECWLLLRQPSAWYWPERGGASVWFPSIKLFRYLDKDLESLLGKMTEMLIKKNENLSQANLHL